MERPFNYNKFKNTDAALEYLGTLVESVDEEALASTIFLDLPDPGALSGEDDGEEDEGGTGDDLHRTLLLQPCELRMGNAKYDDEELPNLSSYGDISDVIANVSSIIDAEVLQNVEIPEAPKVKRPKRLECSLVTPDEPSTSHADSSKLYDEEPKINMSSSNNLPINIPHLGDEFLWENDKKNGTKPIFPQPDYRDCALSPWEMFELFFDNDMFSMIAQESNAYAVLKEDKNPEITPYELKTFIGIMLISGYSQVAGMRSYWCRDGDLYNNMIASAMTRDRFETISKFIHFAPLTAMDPNDKMWKLRPVSDRLIANCIKNFHPEQDLSYDESMIAYYRRHGCKQFIRGKPIRFGFKVWCVNTPKGYLLNFEIYQGKNPRINPVLQLKFGKCVAPLLEMIHALPPELKAHPYCFFFDNLFTGIPVLFYLKHLGYHATGTIRERRIPRNCPLPSNDVIKKKPRGTHCSKTISNLDISVTKWRDNSIVCAASTIFGAGPVEVAKRYSRESSTYINIPRPNVFKEYNKAMGGTDRMDQNVSYYRIATRKKKWWWSIFTYFIDVAIQNAWILHTNAGGSLSHKEFRRIIATHYCTKYANLSQIQKGRKKYNISETDPRFDGLCHYVGPSKSRRRCAYQFCKSTTRLICKKCDVGLCPTCFEIYHTPSENK